MIKKLIQLFLILVLISPFISCGVGNKHTINHIVPRDSFVFLKKILTVYRCDDENGACTSVNFNYVASGYVIKVVDDGSFAVTAAHVCEDNLPPNVESKGLSSKYFVYRLDGEEYRASVLNYDIDIDACMIFIKGLTEDIEPVRISRRAPVPGDKVYNVAAPLGIYKPNIVPLLEGRFNGEDGNVALYTLPAAPGSSGSMIVNEKGELIGMVHSVYIRFPVMTLSTTYDDLINFIRYNLKKYMAYKEVMHILNLKNVFEP